MEAVSTVDECESLTCTTPQLKLEAPSQLMCFQFCPTNPSFIAAGCFNGQVVMWDITCFKEKLKAAPTAKKKMAFNLPQDLDTSPMMEIGRFCSSSSIENSHKAPITQLIWMPHQYEVTKFGALMVNKYELSFQLLTCSVDQTLQFWDIRTIKGLIPGDRKEASAKDLCLSPLTFKHLDLTWKAFLKLSTVKEDMGVDFTPTKILIKTKLSDAEDNVPSSRSMIFLGTEEGDVLYMDWCPTKDQESGKYQAQKPQSHHNVHNGPVVGLQRSPCINDVVLSIGGWNFALWREGYHHGPIFLSGFCSKLYTGGCWSLTKPSVFFIMKSDGSLDVWDLLDRTHEPIHSQNISSSKTSTILPVILPKHLHLLAIGDSTGTLHLLELPPSLITTSPTELTNMLAYIETETKRTSRINTNRMNLEEEENRMNFLEPVSPSKIKKVEEVVEEVVIDADEELYNNYLQLQITFKEQLALA